MSFGDDDDGAVPIELLEGLSGAWDVIVKIAAWQ